MDLESKVKKINSLIASNRDKAYIPFIELYESCKRNNTLNELAKYDIQLINSDKIDNIQIQFKALSLVLKLYEGKNNDKYYSTLLFMGRLYSRIRQLHKALAHIRKALNYFSATNNLLRTINCYSCIGLLYLKIKDYKKALKYFFKGLSILKEKYITIKDPEQKSKIKYQLDIYYYNIAICYFNDKKYKTTKKYILKSLELVELGKLVLSDFHVINMYLHLKMKLNEVEEIDELIQKLFAIKNIKETSMYCLLISTLGNIQEYRGEHVKALKNYKKALKHAKKYYAITTNSYDNIVSDGLKLAFKLEKAKEIAFFSKKMFRIKKLQYEETLYYSDMSLRQLDEISDLELEKKQLEEISYILGHDLKTPVRIIKNMADIIQVEPEQSNELLPKIISNSRYALQLIDATLSFSKLTIDYNLFQKVSLNHVLDTVKGNLESMINDRQAQIFVSDLPEIQGNYSLLEQLFTNLISNALIYCDKKPKIEILYHTSNKNRVIEIRDNGIGISRNELSKVFKLFRKSISNHKEQGTGVGLAICKKIVEIHKGHIYAESQLSQGTSFIIELPIEINYKNIPNKA